MTLRNRVAFAETGLTVAYRASTEPQILEIRAKCPRKPPKTLAGMLFKVLTNCTSKGAGGGEEFAPGQVRFKHVSGPLNDNERAAAGPEWVWKVEVASLAPRYIRNIVEHLSLCGGGGCLLKSMSIIGELGLDDTPMSVRERDVVGWLADPLAWPRAWAKPPFDVKDVVSNGGVSIRLKMGAPITQELNDRVTNELLDAWSSEIAVYVARDGSGGRMIVRPSLSASKTTYAMHYNHFTFEPKPTRDMLVNMLVWFHDNACPIIEAELGFEA
jgi:hypothetical protein